MQLSTQPDGDLCGVVLLDGGGEPLKKFVYHDFKDYVAGLLAQPGIEELVDRVCDDAFAASEKPPPDFVSGTFNATFIRSFMGPGTNSTTRCLFIDCRG